MRRRLFPNLRNRSSVRRSLLNIFWLLRSRCRLTFINKAKLGRHRLWGHEVTYLDLALRPASQIWSTLASFPPQVVLPLLGKLGGVEGPYGGRIWAQCIRSAHGAGKRSGLQSRGPAGRAR